MSGFFFFFNFFIHLFKHLYTLHYVSMFTHSHTHSYTHGIAFTHTESRPASSDADTQFLVWEHIEMQTGGAGDQTAHFLMSRQPAVAPEPQTLVFVFLIHSLFSLTYTSVLSLSVPCGLCPTEQSPAIWCGRSGLIWSVLPWQTQRQNTSAAAAFLL